MQGCKDNELVYDENLKVLLSIMTVLGDREEQQDGFGYLLNDNSVIVTVCDGMGGYEGGKLASSIAVDCYLNNYKEYLNSNLPQSLLDITKEANKRVLSLQKEKIKSGSTVVSVIVEDNKLFWNSVGDSRGYLFRNGAYVQFTQDHNYKTVLNEKKKAGLIDEEEYQRNLAKGDALICHLGLESVDLIDYNDSPLFLNGGDIVLIMTDGLYKILSDEEIFTVINNFNDINEALSALELKVRKNANDRSFVRDNMTVALLKIK